MLRFAFMAFLTLTACTDPSLNAGFTIGTGGVSITPSVSGRVGGATVSVSPCKQRTTL